MGNGGGICHTDELASNSEDENNIRAAERRAHARSKTRGNDFKNLLPSHTTTKPHYKTCYFTVQQLPTAILPKSKTIREA